RSILCCSYHPAPSHTYTLSLHDALPISDVFRRGIFSNTRPSIDVQIEELRVPEGTGRLLVIRIPEGVHKPYGTAAGLYKQRVERSEEHTSELQSRENLVCRLLLEKKKTQ